MGIQKYRFDRAGQRSTNGSVPLYTDWMGGPSLAGIRNCPCPDGVARTVYITNDPDTFFSIPARVMKKGKVYNGFVSVDDDGYIFTSSKMKETYGEG